MVPSWSPKKPAQYGGKKILGPGVRALWGSNGLDCLFSTREKYWHNGAWLSPTPDTAGCSRQNADGRICGAEEATSPRDMAAVSSAACVDERVNRCDRVAFQRTSPPAVAAISALPNLPIAEPSEETAFPGNQRVRHC
jgi:hypothetical protein